jgi:hypothetical protein
MHPLRLSAGGVLAVIPGAVAVCRGRFPRHGDDGMGEPRREAQALLLRLGEGREKEGKHLEKTGAS